MYAPTTPEGDWAPKLGHFQAGHGACSAARASNDDAARWFDHTAAQITLRNKSEKESIK
jgi:hypothetical protein